MARLAEAASAGGDHNRATRLIDDADALTSQIREPDRRAEALARLARILVETGKEILPVPEHVHSSSRVTVQARQLLAKALTASSWTDVVFELARIAPLTVTALADEVQARWGLNAPGCYSGNETQDR